MGNGVCNDDANIADCNYDGGDCCLSPVNTEHCSNCSCHHQQTCLAGVHPLVGDGYCHNELNNADCNYDSGDCCPNSNLVGNGFCNDKTNNANCNFDGGDCCVNVNKDYCSECSCLGGGVIISPGFPGYYGIWNDLTWLIQAPLGQLIELSFLFFKLEGSICK